MGPFRRSAPVPDEIRQSSPTRKEAPGETPEKPSKHHSLPRYNHNGHKIGRYIKPDGESGRKGFSPKHFLKIVGHSTSKVSMVVNVLWPFAPAAIALHFARPDLHVWIFALTYIAMVPAANLLGFTGQELARKLPKVFGILLEVTLGSVVEIILFMVLITKEDGNGRFIGVIQAAILGSILTNLLLCMGLCFFVGGIRRHEQAFHDVIGEVGSGILLVAGFALLIPSAFYSTLLSSTASPTEEGGFTVVMLSDRVLKISRGTAVILLVAFLTYMYFNARSHHGIFDEVLEGDEGMDQDRHKDLKKAKLTFTECVVAILLSLTFVALLAIFLVEEIEFIVDEQGVPDSFMGLILVPLVEKAAEHLTAIDEAYDNQMNFALFHCLGPSIQTALLNAPLVVLVGWGLDKRMDLNFEIFMVALLVLSILVVGNFLRDGKSNYLEGTLCVLVYAIIAMTTWFYPNADQMTTNHSVSGQVGA